MEDLREYIWKIADNMSSEAKANGYQEFVGKCFQAYQIGADAQANPERKHQARLGELANSVHDYQRRILAGCYSAGILAQRQGSVKEGCELLAKALG